MEIIRQIQIQTLSNSGIESQQLISPENSASTRVTITRVIVPSGGISPRHTHAASEQIWVALQGRASLLLADDKTEVFSAGDVARFAEGDVHGLHNAGETAFVYLSVTAPPINFRNAYAQDWTSAIADDARS
jgi:quercetin dioxygenase-like cupin family protein